MLQRAAVQHDGGARQRVRDGHLGLTGESKVVTAGEASHDCHGVRVSVCQFSGDGDVGAPARVRRDEGARGGSHRVVRGVHGVRRAGGNCIRRYGGMRLGEDGRDAAKNRRSVTFRELLGTQTTVRI